LGLASLSAAADKVGQPVTGNTQAAWLLPICMFLGTFLDPGSLLQDEIAAQLKQCFGPGHNTTVSTVSCLHQNTHFVFPENLRINLLRLSLRKEMQLICSSKMTDCMLYLDG
jgi:hypothetical protein